VYTSKDIPIDYMFSETLTQEREYIDTIHEVAFRHYTETVVFAALPLNLPENLDVLANLRQSKPYNNYYAFCARGVGLRLLGFISDMSKNNPAVAVADLATVLELNPWFTHRFRVPLGFQMENCKAFTGNSDGSTLNDIKGAMSSLPLTNIDPAVTLWQTIRLDREEDFLSKHSEWLVYLETSASWVISEMNHQREILGVRSERRRYDEL
jgi:hypothetical protein